MNTLLVVVTGVAILGIYLLKLGPPYVPTLISTREELIRLSRKGKFVDLGSGDGSLVILFAGHGMEAHGYEFNPLLVWLSRRKIKKAGLEGLAKVRWKNFWKVDLSRYDLIYIFGAPHIMKKLEAKFEAEMKPSAIFISNAFKLPTWKPTERKGSLLIYEKRAGS